MLRIPIAAATLSGLAIALIGFAPVLTACEEEGPAEKAGEAIDEAVDTVGDKMEEAGDKIEKSTE